MDAGSAAENEIRISIENSFVKWTENGWERRRAIKGENEVETEELIGRGNGVLSRSVRSVRSVRCAGWVNEAASGSD